MSEDKKSKLNPKAKRVLIAVVAVVCAAVVFFLGYITSYFTNTSMSASLKWALDVIESKYYEDIDADMTGVAIDAIVDTYLDQYSEYYTAEEYKALVSSNEGNQTGIGVTATYVEGSGMLVYRVLGNSPAWKSGLRTGEYLTGGSYNGSEVTFSASYSLLNFVNSVETGEEITLYSADGGEYVMTKSSYKTSYAYLCTNSTAWTIEYDSSGNMSLVESVDDKIDYLPDGCGYIKLQQFYGDAATEFGYLLKMFYELDCDTLYLDLRSNGGGYVKVMQKISSYFISSGNLVMCALYKDNTIKVAYSTSTGVDVSVDNDTSVYVLANSNTASASEALMGVLISYGVIDYEDIYISYYGDDYINWLGTDAKNGKTYGKGIMQDTIVNAATGEALKLTTAKIYWPNGTCIHGVGLTADDGCNMAEASWIVTKTDEELQYVVQNSQQ